MVSTYAFNFTTDNNPQVFMGSWVWKLDIWPKISSFLWLCHYNSVPMRQVIVGRGINCDTTCPLCKNHEETLLHLLIGCPYTATFWKAIKTPHPLYILSHLDLPEWLRKNCLDNNQLPPNGLPWCTQFLFAIWGL